MCKSSSSSQQRRECPCIVNHHKLLDDLISLDIEEGRMEVPVKQEEEELTAEEKRKIERKLKKERKKKEKQLLNEAGALVEKVKPQQSSAKDLALKYLMRWSKKHKDWRFQKTRQTWLLKHMYDCDKMSDKHFTALLNYLDGLKGNAREVTIQKAEALMEDLETTDGSTEDSPAKIERIRQVLQILS
ncbi:protein cholesin isoform X2 [Scyliorhinus torazame]|uniref:protein cholesin isoform X2 n=1 Tax=Scyliorhinus torazame TaxID=75743 RepID=UPI003B5CC8EB